jgi:hypothetical protein
VSLFDFSAFSPRRLDGQQLGEKTEDVNKDISFRNFTR